ncbi:hypothetical protein PM082_023536 [Marasmius tenuissimus]|nr:hypothetical protein PM082_023536 [Marasmius tenuissimus]
MTSKYRKRNVQGKRNNRKGAPLTGDLISHPMPISFLRTQRELALNARGTQNRTHENKDSNSPIPASPGTDLKKDVENMKTKLASRFGENLRRSVKPSGLGLGRSPNENAPTHEDVTRTKGNEGMGKLPATTVRRSTIIVEGRKARVPLGAVENAEAHVTARHTARRVRFADPDTVITSPSEGGQRNDAVSTLDIPSPHFDTQTQATSITDSTACSPANHIHLANLTFAEAFGIMSGANCTRDNEVLALPRAFFQSPPGRLKHESKGLKTVKSKSSEKRKAMNSFTDFGSKGASSGLASPLHPLGIPSTRQQDSSKRHKGQTVQLNRPLSPTSRFFAGFVGRWSSALGGGDDH